MVSFALPIVRTHSESDTLKGDESVFLRRFFAFDFLMKGSVFPKPFLAQLFTFMSDDEVVRVQRVSRVWLSVSKAYLTSRPDPKFHSVAGRLFWLKRAAESLHVLNNVPLSRSLEPQERDLHAQLLHATRIFSHSTILATIEDATVETYRMDHMEIEGEWDVVWPAFVSRVRPLMQIVSSSSYPDHGLREKCEVRIKDWILRGESNCNPASHAELTLFLLHEQRGTFMVSAPRSFNFGHANPAMAASFAKMAEAAAAEWKRMKDEVGWRCVCVCVCVCAIIVLLRFFNAQKVTFRTLSFGSSCVASCFRSLGLSIHKNELFVLLLCQAKKRRWCVSFGSSSVGHPCPLGRWIPVAWLNQHLLSANETDGALGSISDAAVNCHSSQHGRRHRRGNHSSRSNERRFVLKRDVKWR